MVALVHYIKAKDANIPEAYLNLGFLYHYGLGTPIDDEKAFEYFSLAARHDLPQAQYHLGLLYQDGKWVSKDKIESAYWLDKASKHGIEEAELMIQALAMREPEDVDLYITN